MTSPAGKPATIAQKARRKISLPWFRQGSVAPPHPALSRQHTIDTPSSFQARLLRRQPSLSQTGITEMTWVVADHSAAPGTRELSVTKGQQVEVLENGSSYSGSGSSGSNSTIEWTLVRLPLASGQSEPSAEGLVPTSALKQPPTTSCKTSPSRKPLTSTQPTVTIAQQPSVTAEDADSGGNETANGSASTSSPGNKRRGFSGRKWLPQPLRKLSQGKVEKSSPPDRAPTLKKTGSDKRFKLPTSDKTSRTVSEGEEGEEEEAECEYNETPEKYLEQNGGEDAEDDFELPPPMKPITEPILVASGNGPTGSALPDELSSGISSGSGGTSSTKRTSERSLDGATSADLAEIEQIVKERMEQHTENQERHSMMSTVRPSTRGSSTEGDSQYGSSSIVEEGSIVDAETAAITKREFVIRELVETESDYVNDLKTIVEGYMALMRDPENDIPLPEDLRGGKDKMVFGNLEAIYEWHRDFFLKALERCIERPEELGPLFKRYERKLHMYVVYCQNKPVSEYIVSEYIDTYFEELRQKLGHRLQLCDLLIKPVQRITKYQLLLREALRLTEKTSRISEIEGLRAAAHVMRVIPKAANDMMDVGRLQGFDGKITAQGKLLLHGPLLVNEISNIPQRGREWQVFLFEQNIIFSEALGKKTQFTNPAYVHKAHIQVNKMILEDAPDDPEKFLIRSTDPRKPGIGFICSPIEDNGPRRQEWVDTITSILQTQRDFLKAIQSPIAYQKELTKDPL